MEVGNGYSDWHTIQLRRSARHGVMRFLFLNRSRKLLGIFREFEGVERSDFLVHLDEAAWVERNVDSVRGRKPMMVPAVRTHAQVLLKVNREDYFFAVCALQESFWFVLRLVAQGSQDTAFGAKGA